MFTVTSRLKRLPIWPLFILSAALLYFVCFYNLEKPYQLHWCQESDINKCSEFFRNGLLRIVWRDFSFAGIPGLIAMFVGRKSPKFLCIWLACFAAWTYFIAIQGPGGVDGQNGCEGCEAGGALMYIFSLIAFICAMFVAFTRGSI